MKSEKPEPVNQPWIRNARKRVVLDFRGKKYARVAGTACWHVGNPSCREAIIRTMLKHFGSDRIPWVHLGDTIEAITPVDSRFHAETHEATIQNQEERSAALMAEARDMLIGVIRGNHEDIVARLYGNPIKTILTLAYAGEKNFNANARSKWLGGLAIIDLVCPGGVCKWLVHHPKITITRGIGSPDHDDAVRRRALRRFARFWKADLKMLGHPHRFVVAPPTFEDRLDYSDLEIHEVRDPIDQGWVATCASMFAGYDSETEYPSYAECHGYPPTQIGWLEAVIDRNGKVVTAEAIKG